MKYKLLILVLTITCYTNAQPRRQAVKVNQKTQTSENPTVKTDSTQIALILTKLVELKAEVDLISSKISPTENIETYKDSLRILREENENQKRTIETIDRESKQFKADAQNQKKSKENIEKQKGESYSNLANNLIKFGTILPKEVMDSITENLPKKNLDFELFKTQSADLKFAQELLYNSTIKPEDYNKLKLIMSGKIDPKFLEQNKLLVRLKKQYEEFNKYGKLLTTLLNENSSITDLKYRKNLIDFDFPSKEACLTIPYLAKKLNEAYTINKTSIDLDFP
jgi:hypothetical protein